MEFAERYSRQLLFAPLGAEGQARLGRSRVAMVGCGATGSALVSLLARAGVGYLRLIDRDYVEPSNLQRQVLFDEADAAESLPKAVAAARKIASFNSQIAVEAHPADLTPDTVQELLGEVDLILDGTDNFETRYLVNDFAVSRGVPWIYSAGVGSYGVTMKILPGETACLACVFPDSPRGVVETCDTAGILNSAVNLVASVAATEAMKLLPARVSSCGVRCGLTTCGAMSMPKSAPPSLAPVAAPAANATSCISPGKAARPSACAGEIRCRFTKRRRPMDFAEMTRRLSPHGAVRYNEFVLKFWREPYEMTLFPDGRAIIKGTSDTGIARSLYARYVGS